MSKDVVIRISRENHKRLKDLMDGDEKLTVNKLMEKMLDSLENLSNSEIIYVVNGKSFTDVSIARGEAVLIAAEKKEEIQWPMIAAVVGRDQGA